MSAAVVKVESIEIVAHNRLQFVQVDGLKSIVASEVGVERVAEASIALGVVVEKSQERLFDGRPRILLGCVVLALNRLVVNVDVLDSL